tara:strand:- start:3628 stop:5397 length:1770 start_codon:yes stop_codon:yes gene_type:complete
MIILGIHDGHNASAALIKDGKLICSLAEERFSRIKNHFGYPSKAITAILDYAGLKKSDIDSVAMSSKNIKPAYFYVSRNSQLSVKDYLKEQKEYWYPKLYENKNPSYLEIFKYKVDEENFPYDKTLIKDENDWEGMWEARKKFVAKDLGIVSQKINYHDHHKCHAFYGYMACSNKNIPLLIYTMDGFGDGANGTVSIVQPGERIKEISRSSNCNIGRIYRYATLLLGMKPAEHEYKLMGLAAYNSHKYGEDAYKVYAETLQVDGLGFSYQYKPKDHFFYFKDKLDGERFDAVAYGIQKRTEELLTEWISNGIDQTGIKNVIMSGGVAQNIKANQKICELHNIEELFIPPGPSDESISIGAAFLEYESSNKIISDNTISNAYMGLSFSNEEIKNAIDNHAEKDWDIEKADNDQVAQHLAKGDIIARFGADQMEFGARALGNRSIVADPRNLQTLHKINKYVKMRDFWMPFAPSIIEERMLDYIVNDKLIEARFMAVGFNTTELAKKEIPAGIHPFDKTARPQIVTQKDNPGYHSLIKAFEKLTGIGALLNTSFNIHGEPIVGTPSDAIDTFKRSGIQHLLLGDFLVSKIR